ncbi:hypothetical protein [Micromonospora chalcea]|uniref:hypothetical protein n=1 Tax=Micromonospora chalcea TaxID=1874 RepID=UPI003796689F
MDLSEVVAGAIGVLLGIAGDRSIIQMGRRRSQKQVQKAGNFSNQSQVGGNVTTRGEDVAK